MRARCELLFNFGREKPSSSLRPRGFCPGERVRSRRNVKPERALLCREGSGRVLGSTLKLTPLARSPRFLVSRPLVKGVGVFARTRGRRETERRERRWPKYRLRVPVCDYDGRLHPDHATPPPPRTFFFSSSLLSSPFLVSLARAKHYPGG